MPTSLAAARASGTPWEVPRTGERLRFTVWYYEAISGFGVGDVEGSGGFDSRWRSHGYHL